MDSEESASRLEEKMNGARVGSWGKSWRAAKEFSASRGLTSTHVQAEGPVTARSETSALTAMFPFRRPRYGSGYEIVSCSPPGDHVAHLDCLCQRFAPWVQPSELAGPKCIGRNSPTRVMRKHLAWKSHTLSEADVASIPHLKLQWIVIRWP